LVKWQYVICNIMFALHWFHDFIYQDMKEVKHMTEKGMDLPVCVRAWCTCLWDVCSELFLTSCWSCASSYNGFCLLTCCSLLSSFCWRYIWMYMFSQWFIFLLFLHGYIPPTKPTHHGTAGQRTTPVKWTHAASTRNKRQFTTKHPTDKYIRHAHT
jgi:hypothetical protein